MDVNEFSYDLPAGSIAQRPLDERDASRMLLVDRSTGAWQDRTFREFPEQLRGGELVVINNTRVLPARLFGWRGGRTGTTESAQAPIEVLLVRQIGPGRWETLVRPGKKVQVGERIIFGDGELEAQVKDRGERGLRVLQFKSKADFHDAVARLGHIPLPPYIKRPDEALDHDRYQTVYAREGSAVAAPTAGLHFTSEILRRLKDRGAEIAEIALDVGLGTFEPVRTGQMEEHKIHDEAYDIPAATAEAVCRARRENRPVLAVGTTVVRALEDSAEKNIGKSDLVVAGRTEARIFIYPGKPFRVVDQLLTNFHLPRSSLLALVAAFAGRENVLRAYRHAVDSGYRFYSYGDCMLIR
jgi:S-adenosylmethionine:tRNA ribosyltransferase-isomerase